MRMVFITILAWAVFVVAGVVVIQATSGPGSREQYIVVKQLRPNHRLVEGDVAEVGAFFRFGSQWTRFLIPDQHSRSDFRGRYVPKPMKQDEKIELAETFSGPRLTARAGAIAWVPLRDLPASEIASLDVQDFIDVCNLRNDSRCGRFTVEAIACAGDEPSGCAAAIDLNAEQQKHIWSSTGAKEIMAQVHVLTVGGSESGHVHRSGAHHHVRSGKT